MFASGTYFTNYHASTHSFPLNTATVTSTPHAQSRYRNKISAGSIRKSPPHQYVLRPRLRNPQVPFQHIHTSTFAIPSDLADKRVEFSAEMLQCLNGIFGTNVPFDDYIAEHFLKCVPLEWDVGTAYGHLRPWWDGFASGKYSFWEMDTFLGDRRTQDLNIHHRDALASTQRMGRDSFLYRRQGEGNGSSIPKFHHDGCGICTAIASCPTASSALPIFRLRGGRCRTVG